MHSALRPSIHNCKISNCMLKPGSKTHSALQQCSSQPQTESSQLSLCIRAVESSGCAPAMAHTLGPGAHPGCYIETNKEVKFTQPGNSAAHNCEHCLRSLRIYPNVSSNTSSRVHMVCTWNGAHLQGSKVHTVIIFLVFL